MLRATCKNDLEFTCDKGTLCQFDLTDHCRESLIGVIDARSAWNHIIYIYVYKHCIISYIYEADHLSDV